MYGASLILGNIALWRPLSDDRNVYGDLAILTEMGREAMQLCEASVQELPRCADGMAQQGGMPPQIREADLPSLRQALLEKVRFLRAVRMASTDRGPWSQLSDWIYYSPVAEALPLTRGAT